MIMLLKWLSQPNFWVFKGRPTWDNRIIIIEAVCSRISSGTKPFSKSSSKLVLIMKCYGLIKYPSYLSVEICEGEGDLIVVWNSLSWDFSDSKKSLKIVSQNSTLELHVREYLSGFMCLLCLQCICIPMSLRGFITTALIFCKYKVHDYNTRPKSIPSCPT